MADIKTLINKSNRCVIDILQKTAEIAVQRSHYEISVEHFFMPPYKIQTAIFIKFCKISAKMMPNFWQRFQEI